MHHYSFQHLLGYDEQAFWRKRKNWKGKIREDSRVEIIASDISLRLCFCKRELQSQQEWGIKYDWIFKFAIFEKQRFPERPREWLLFNSKYGERLGENEWIESNLQANGKISWSSNGAGYRGYIFYCKYGVGQKKKVLKASRKSSFGTARWRPTAEYDINEGKKERINQKAKVRSPNIQTSTLLLYFSGVRPEADHFNCLFTVKKWLAELPHEMVFQPANWLIPKARNL